MTDVKQYMDKLGKQAKQAARIISAASTEQKNNALNAIAKLLLDNAQNIMLENKKDMQAGKQRALDDALLDRLMLDENRIESMAQSLQQIATLADPIGSITNLESRPSGIQVGKMRVPLGVIGIIYESRPNVTADAAALCLKSGNATILRGGSEAKYSNQAIAKCIKQGLANAGLPDEVVQVIETTDREAVGCLLTMNNYVDVIIPRGGKSLIERVSQDATIAVIKHLDGICHVYIDDDADVEKAVAIADNAKTHRYGVCNAMETLLVAQSMASKVLLPLADIYHKKGVELRGCDKTYRILSGIKKATAEDWDTEYLAPILSIKIVDDMQQAMDHIAEHSSQHTETIVTENYAKARTFLRQVDSSSVMVNASTRFADGFEYGLGAEIGISTDKLHVRGPVGIEGLTTQKYVVLGDGHIRS